MFVSLIGLRTISQQSYYLIPIIVLLLDSLVAKKLCSTNCIFDKLTSGRFSLAAKELSVSALLDMVFSKRATRTDEAFLFLVAVLAESLSG